MRTFHSTSHPWLAICLLAMALGHRTAEAAPAASQVGAHQRILVVQKNVNPQNLLVVFTKVDGNGSFVRDAAQRNRPVLDFYWLMNGKDYKPVHPRIKREIRQRFECQTDVAAGSDHFAVAIKDLKEVDADIDDPKMDIYASGTGKAASAEAHLSLGASDGNVRIKLTSIATEGRAFPAKVYSVTVQGEEVVDGKLTGRKVTRRYEAKKNPKLTKAE